MTSFARHRSREQPLGIDLDTIVAFTIPSFQGALGGPLTQAVEKRPFINTEEVFGTFAQAKGIPDRRLTPRDAADLLADAAQSVQDRLATPGTTTTKH
ncbi:hypothetical protein HDG34_002656 [Paraburkholderia sp. HC6.4b]|uniref:hypothetical protein n=1 Tax=unclassified Paraburkholderia TaxID=2615204 RepID=UPI00161364D5|nr:MULTISPECIES: hypothetical protein [unclassified Paraburkholderia]MBB5408719.1 hypothetical protein [Paraburkholderia sp. HC6.4b]MBB5450549.1 hypothetical protein [Paraburkholderia sp. Kb1A]